jgi:hypothetical protein
MYTSVFVLSWWDLIGNFCSVVLTFDLIDCQDAGKSGYIIFCTKVRRVNQAKHINTKTFRMSSVSVCPDQLKNLMNGGLTIQ